VFVLVIVLIVTNLLTLAALIYARLRPAAEPEPQPGDEQVRAALAALARQGPPTARTRQFISVEILNPLELANTRGRLLGLAGSFAPGFTRRMVYDQTVKELKRQLVAQHVIADVHVHNLRPVAQDAAAVEPAVPSSSDARTLLVEPANFVDEVDVPLERGEGQPPV
jgi:hypothetical protein